MLIDIPVNIRTLPRIFYLLSIRITKNLQGLKIEPMFGPEVVYLEVSRACNLNCPMCLRRLLPTDELTGFMDADVVKRIVNNLGNVIGVGLSGWGEPLLHPQIIDILEYISNKGILISFDTNGMFIKDYARELIKIKTLYHIGLSLDFVSKKVKGAHDSAEILEGLKTIIEEKRKSGRKYPVLRVTMTVMKCNVDEIPKIVEEVAKYGGKWFDCHMVMVFDAKCQEEYKRPHFNELVKYFNEAKKIGYKKGIKVTYERKEEILKGKREEKAICNEPWKAVFIDYKGIIHPCCFYLSKNLGDARSQPILKIWKSRMYAKFREQLLNGKEYFCNSCMKGYIPFLSHTIE